MKQKLPENLLAEWDYTKNGDPNTVPKTVDTVWWVGAECGHEFRASTDKRKSGRGCPICSGKQVLKGYNDLGSRYPEIADEWDTGKNSVSPDSVTSKSNKTVHWKCRLDSRHRWEARVCDRTKGNGCPVCRGLKVIPGVNDFRSRHPEMALEWGDNDRGPESISEFSGYRASWVCLNDSSHKWEAIVANRTSKGKGCPFCSKGQTSKSEMALVDFIRGQFPEWTVEVRAKIVASTNHSRNLELDVFLPEINLGIEFNGVYWHSVERGVDRNAHRHKRKSCEAQGIRLITIWEDEWNTQKEVVGNFLVSEISGIPKVYESKDEVVINLDRDDGKCMPSYGYQFVEELPPTSRIAGPQNYTVWNSGHALYRRLV